MAGKVRTWLINSLGGFTGRQQQEQLQLHGELVRAECQLRESLNAEFLTQTCTELNTRMTALSGTVQQLLDERERLVGKGRLQQSMQDHFKQVLYRLTKGQPVLVVLMPDDVVGPQDLTESSAGLKPVYPWMIGQPAGFSRLVIRRLTSP